VTEGAIEPRFRLECDGGVIAYGESGRHVVGTASDGRVTDYGDPDATHQFQKLFAAIDRAGLPGDTMCGVEAAAAQTACMIAMHESAVAIVTFPALIRRAARRAGPRAPAGGRTAPLLSGVGAAERDRLPLGRARPAGAADAAVVLRGCRARAVGRSRQERVVNSRELVRRTLRFDRPSRVPRQAWVLPWAEQQYPGWVARLRAAFPDDLMAAPQLYRVPLPVVGSRYEKGLYIDEWGCRFHNIHGGVIGIVHEPLIADWSQLDRFRAPEEVLTVDTDAVRPSAAIPHGSHSPAPWCARSSACASSGPWSRRWWTWRKGRRISSSCCGASTSTTSAKSRCGPGPTWMPS